VTRYPDLTADGSFILGSSVFATITLTTGSWPLAFAASLLAGALAGAFTSALHTLFGINRLLTGILTSMIAYSIAFRVMGGSPTANLVSAATPFAAARDIDAQHFAEWGAHWSQLAILLGFAVVLTGVVSWTLRSENGLAMRAAGANPWLAVQFRQAPAGHQLTGLALSNALVAAAGAIVSGQQGFADVNLGVGLVITLVAALIMGEAFVRLVLRTRPRFGLAFAVTPFVGATLYFILYLLIVRASIRGWIPFAINPTDLKILSALTVILILAFRRSKGRDEELLPF
jgi:putative ABC transport system permease protein